MNKVCTSRNNWRSRGRSSRAASALLAALLLPLSLAAGCGDDESAAFRAVAFPTVEKGVQQIAEGLIEGFFELNTPSGQNAAAAD